MQNNNFTFHIEYDKNKNSILKYSINNKLKTEIETIPFLKPIYLLKPDVINLKFDTNKFKQSTKIIKSNQKDEIVKITPIDNDSFEELKSLIHTYSLKTFEFDLNESNTYTIENNQDIGKEISYHDSKIISLDIETIGTESKQEINLISLSSYTKKYSNKVLINQDKLSKEFENLKNSNLVFDETFELVWCKNEKELLKALKKDILDFQPQFILGWNVIGFDFKVIKERCSKYGIEFNFSNFKGETKMRVSNDFFGKDSLSFPGILVLDCIQLLKTNYLQFEDYKLNSVAKSVLGDSKIDLDESEDSNFSIAEKIKTIEHNWNTNPKKLIWYNYKDSTLVLDIVKELGLLDLMFQRSIITQTIFERIQSPIAILDQMYLKELHKINYVANTHYPNQGTTPIEGAHVIDPKSGLYKDIVVFDFASLYPSLMITFNIDPFTYSEEGEIIAPNDARFKKEKGILPKILEDLFNLRMQAKKEKNSIKSHALKITMNSFYGAMASPKARYYNKHLAEAITAFGRECLLQAKEFLEHKELNVIYGDTDSVFVEMNFKEKDSKEDKKDKILKIENEINSHFKHWVKNKYGVDSFLKIEGEKLFERFFIATKKRYVGLDHNKELQITGLEAIRGDWTPLAQKFQIKLINQIFNDSSKEDLKKFIHNYIVELKAGKHDEDLIYTKKITKPLSEYTKTTPPHVKAAREISNFNGRVVKYVMNEQGPKHISLYDSKTMKYDYEHYIDKQLQGVSDEILLSIGLNFNEIIYEKKQTNLNKFF